MDPRSEGRRLAPVIAVGLLLGCRAERLSAMEADEVGAAAVAAVADPDVAPGPEVLELLDHWRTCAGEAADAELRVVGGAEDADRGVLVLAHEGTASRRAVRAAPDADAVECVRRRTGDDTFAATTADPPRGADVGARASATVAGREVHLRAVAADAFIVLAGGVRPPDLDAAVAAIEEAS